LSCIAEHLMGHIYFSFKFHELHAYEGTAL